MRGGPWHVFHFVGHGGFDRDRDEGLIFLPGDDGRSRDLTAGDLARLLAVHRTLRLVVLNACEGARGSDRDIFSSTASILVRRGIPAVVAMQYPITDRAAVEFARGFYEALADGLPVDAAVNDARQALSLSLSPSVEWGTPVLHMRASDGYLFDLRPGATPVSAQTEELARQAETRPIPRTSAQREDVQTPTPATRTALPAVLMLTSPLRLEFVRIPAGEFLMGSDPVKDRDAYDAEKPQHRVHLPDFYIARVPVTNSHFEVFVKAKGAYMTTAESAGFGWVWTASKWEQVQGADWRHPRGPKTGIAQKADHPVVQISWLDAVAFCWWLSETTRQSFRLPTEAEWEKAARGAKGRRYPWGGEPPEATRCNFARGVGDTTSVGKYPAGATPDYGVLDMAGNVWEWTASLWGKWVEGPDYGYPYNPRDGREEQDVPGDVFRVLRGGSWGDLQWLVRAAVRYWPYPGLRFAFVGFRCVRSA